MHVRFSQYRTQGVTEVWRDGEVVQPARTSRTMTTSRSYLKLGYYRSASVAQPGVVFHDGMRIERSRASVAGG